MALLNCLAAFLHDSHAHLHQQRHNYNQRRNDETVDHGADASLLHAGEGGIQSDGSQCADLRELAGSLGAAYQLRRDRKDARHDGHGQKTQNEPGEDLLDGELSFKRTAVLLESHGFLTLQVQLHKGEHDHRGDDRQRAGQLDHGGEIACRLGEGPPRRRCRSPPYLPRCQRPDPSYPVPGP